MSSTGKEIELRSRESDGNGDDSSDNMDKMFDRAGSAQPTVFDVCTRDPMPCEVS